MRGITAVIDALAKIRLAEYISDLFAAVVIIDRMPPDDPRRSNALQNLRILLSEATDHQARYGVEVDAMRFARVRQRVLVTLQGDSATFDA